MYVGADQQTEDTTMKQTLETIQNLDHSKASPQRNFLLSMERRSYMDIYTNLSHGTGTNRKY